MCFTSLPLSLSLSLPLSLSTTTVVVVRASCERALSTYNRVFEYDTQREERTRVYEGGPPHLISTRSFSQVTMQTDEVTNVPCGTR